MGLTLQRKSHILEDEKVPHDVRRPPHRRRRWQLGMAMFIVSNLVGSTIQITTLPLPVLSTLQASGLVETRHDAFIVEAGAGLGWHDVVTATLERGWPGLENLALILSVIAAIDLIFRFSSRLRFR